MADPMQDAEATTVAEPSWPGRLWNRQLGHYPATTMRIVYLAIAVVSTITLYYELYVQGAVATEILSSLGMSFRFFVLILIVGNALGAMASLAAGLADRWGRANLVAYGLAISGLLILFGLPNAGSKWMYMVMFAVLSIVEGALLVATPALVRDFSPQLGRATAMGFWTLGPVLGSLLVAEIGAATVGSHADWQFQFKLAGYIGLGVWLVAMVGLRELAPRLRDQLMVSTRDTALIEARAAGAGGEARPKGQWRQMLRRDIVGSAFGVSIMLLFYYTAVAFFVVFFAVAFGYTLEKANSLANWYWATNAIALVVTGVLSDFLKVRKPFMLAGGSLGAIGVALFAIYSGDTSTTYEAFIWPVVMIAAGGGIAYCAWMASFTETVERHNPAATATGLAVWGWILRTVVTLAFLGLTVMVTATNTVVNANDRVHNLTQKYAPQLKTLQEVDPQTLAVLSANPQDQLAQLKAVAEIAATRGVNGTTVLQLVAIQRRYPQEIQTLQTVDFPTLLVLSQSPHSPTAIGKAVGELTTKFGGSPQGALSRLAALQKVPQAQLQVVINAGPAVAQSENQLLATASVPQSDLAYLQSVQSAQHKTPGEWQKWWWVCFAGQLLFLPFILIMSGRWSPRKARADIALHEKVVRDEMATLGIS